MQIFSSIEESGRRDSIPRRHCHQSSIWVADSFLVLRSRCLIAYDTGHQLPVLSWHPFLPTMIIRLNLSPKIMLPVIGRPFPTEDVNKRLGNITQFIFILSLYNISGIPNYVHELKIEHSCFASSTVENTSAFINAACRSHDHNRPKLEFCTDRDRLNCNLEFQTFVSLPLRAQSSSASII